MNFILALIAAIPVTFLINKLPFSPSLRTIMREGEDGCECGAPHRPIFGERDTCPHCKKKKLYLQQFEHFSGVVSFGPILWNELSCPKCGVVAQYPEI
ncbi:MAG: hypothetical protein WC791_00490 [Candidatus Paceibacterota bacterium]